MVELLKSNNITKVKLFDADPLVLPALSGSNIGVTVGIPNSMLRSFNSSKKAAESWVHDNVTRYFSNGGSGVRIEYVFDFFLFSWALAQWRLIRYCNEILGLGSFLVLPLMLGNENVGFFSFFLMSRGYLGFLFFVCLSACMSSLESFCSYLSCGFGLLSFSLMCHHSWLLCFWFGFLDYRFLVNFGFVMEM